MATTTSITSPCVGVCEMDDATGFCLGCGRTKDEITQWRDEAPSFRDRIWQEIPDRLSEIGVSWMRLPWTNDDIKAFVIETLETKSGVWVMGASGAIGEFIMTDKAPVDVERDGDTVIGSTYGGRVRFDIHDRVRAISIAHPDGDPDRSRIILAVSKSRGGLETASTLTPLGPDAGAIDPGAADESLYDIGLDREDVRFELRTDDAQDRALLERNVGKPFTDTIPALVEGLSGRAPTRVIETMAGRMEISTPLPTAGNSPPMAPHTHLTLKYVLKQLAAPGGMELPPIYAAGAIFYPSAR